jgi:RHS repeat-associated protein
MLQSDGKIVLAGQTGGDFAIARLHAEGGSSDVRHYAMQDANFNVTAIAASADATVLERFLYDPYGSATVLDRSFAVDADGVSDLGWAYLHQGGRYDVDSGLYHFRRRDYSPSLARWLQQDPIGFKDGLNRYAYVYSAPVNYRDPRGTSGQINFVNCTQAQLDEWYLVPEDGLKVSHPVIGSNKNVDGMFRVKDNGDWVKVPSHCTLTLDCSTGGTTSECGYGGICIQKVRGQPTRPVITNRRHDAVPGSGKKPITDTPI